MTAMCAAALTYREAGVDEADPAPRRGMDLAPSKRKRRRGQMARKVPSPREAFGEQVRRRLVGSLARFVRWAWPLLNPGVDIIWGRHIDAICAQLEAITAGTAGRITVVNIPPGHCKTTIISVCWPVWEWLRLPHHRWIFATHSQTNAIKDNEARRDLLSSPEFLAMFRPHVARSPSPAFDTEVDDVPDGPDVTARLRKGWKLATGKNLKSRFGNTQRGSMRALSVGTKVTGDHGDRLIIDDPLDAEEIHGPALVGHIRWFYDKLSTRTRTDTRVVLVMQRLHESDLAGVITARAREDGTLGQPGGVDLLVFPSHFDPDDDSRHSCTVSGWQDWRARKGQLLWPERFTEAMLQERGRDMGGAAYAAQYEQNTVVEDGMMFDPKLWKRWTRLPTNGRMRWYLSVDTTTGSTTMDADYTVLQVWMFSAPDLYLVHQLRGKWSIPDVADKVRELLHRFPLVGHKLVEDKAGGRSLIDSLEKLGVGGVVPVKVRAEKVFRADKGSMAQRAGRIHLPQSPEPGFDVDAFIEEHRRFPRGKDDQVDATSQMVSHVLAMMVGRPSAPMPNMRVSKAAVSARRGGR